MSKRKQNKRNYQQQEIVIYNPANGIAYKCIVFRNDGSRTEPRATDYPHCEGILLACNTKLKKVDCYSFIWFENQANV